MYVRVCVFVESFDIYLNNVLTRPPKKNAEFHAEEDKMPRRKKKKNPHSTQKFQFAHKESHIFVRAIFKLPTNLT